MKRLALFGLLLGLTVLSYGCARPNEFGYTPAYTTPERFDLIARNWDNEGKQLMDDIDSLMLLRPSGRMSIWNLQ